MDGKIVIKKGESYLEFNRKSLLSATETYDGMEFRLLNNISISVTDMYFPTLAKVHIINIVTKMKGDIYIDFDNYNNPVSVNQ